MSSTLNNAKVREAITAVRKVIENLQAAQGFASVNNEVEIIPWNEFLHILNCAVVILQDAIDRQVLFPNPSGGNIIYKAYINALCNNVIAIPMVRYINISGVFTFGYDPSGISTGLRVQINYASLPRNQPPIVIKNLGLVLENFYSAMDALQVLKNATQCL